MVGGCVCVGACLCVYIRVNTYISKHAVVGELAPEKLKG